MTDFTESFKKGQAAAANLERARAEVKACLDTLREQMSEATDGALEIGLMSHAVEKKRSHFLISALDLSKFEPPVYQTFLSGRNRKVDGSTWRKIARWQESEEGYPCTVTVGSEDRVCFDAESLDEAIADLLELGSIGEILKGILGETPPAQPVDSTSSS